MGILRTTLLGLAPLSVATLQLPRHETQELDLRHEGDVEQSVDIWPFDDWDEDNKTSTTPASTDAVVAINATNTSVPNATNTSAPNATTSIAPNTTEPEREVATVTTTTDAHVFSPTTTSTTSVATTITTAKTYVFFPTTNTTTIAPNTTSDQSLNKDLTNQSNASIDSSRSNAGNRSSSDSSHEANSNDGPGGSSRHVGELGPGSRWEYHHSDQQTQKQKKSTHNESSQVSRKDEHTITHEHTSGNGVVRWVHHINSSNGSHRHDSGHLGGEDFGGDQQNMIRTVDKNTEHAEIDAYGDVTRKHGTSVPFS